MATQFASGAATAGSMPHKTLASDGGPGPLNCQHQHVFYPTPGTAGESIHPQWQSQESTEGLVSPSTVQFKAPLAPASNTKKKQNIAKYHWQLSEN